jgi:peroxiredoxin
MENNRESNTNHWVDERLAELSPNVNWQPDANAGLARLREQMGARADRRRRRWPWLIAAGSAASVALMAFPAPRVFAQRCLAACTNETSRVGELLWHGFSSPAPVHGDVTPQAHRRMAPDFTLTDASGKPVRLSTLRGKVVLLNFWATWCSPCRAEIPWFVEFQRRFGEREFVVLGVSLDEGGWRIVKPFVEELGMNYPVMIGNDDVAGLYEVKSLPFTLIVDKHGRIASTCAGVIAKNDYEAEIKTILAEQ